MKLSTFIRSHAEAILSEWDAFARASVPGRSGMSEQALRDDAREMLNEIAREMETAQSDREQQRKSQGQGLHAKEAGSAASLHGHQRHSQDFTLLQVSAEFRALRATVLRLWGPQLHQADAGAMQEVIRFNEAIDKALAESIVAWSERTGHTRELFLAILGHDLRSPLANIALASEVMATSAMTPERNSQLARNVLRASKVMAAMINDLMSYTGSQLGRGLPQHLEQCDLVPALQSAIADAMGTYPGTQFDLRAPEALVGSYDRTRLYQMFLNLLVNAARHGTQDCPVHVEAFAAGGDHCVCITNQGEPIPAASLQSIFKPLVQLTDEDHVARPRTSLGLGLFIAREIAESHGGAIGVTSSKAEGTRFSVTLPGGGQGKPGD